MSERIVLRELFGHTQDFSKLAWKPFRAGVEIARIYGGDDDGGESESSRPSAALLRYAAGARIPTHAHTGYEHIVVLAGSQRDERGTYEAGTCMIHSEGTAHTVASDEGCVVLAIWQSPVRFVEPEPA
jgi:anti-sigma factor ChrR (cupin superfamily)